jgi:phage tail-like protein
MPVAGANIGLSLAEGAGFLRIDPYLAHSFAVEIEGILLGGFSDVAGLQVETETLEYREGGLNEYVHHFAGATKHPPLVLKHGLSPIDGLWQWHQDVVAGVIERHHGTIYLLNSRSQPLMWWEIRGALPVKWTGPQLNASSSTVAFESVELAHQGLGRPRPVQNGPGDGIAPEFVARLALAAGRFF